MAINQIEKVWDSDLEPNKRLVMLAYADHANRDGTGMWPSKKRLGKMCGYSPRQIQRIRKELVEDGYLVKTREPQDQRPPEYKFNWEGGQSDPPRGGQSDSPPGDNLSPPGETQVSPEPSSMNRKEEGSSGSARAQARMPEQLEPVYGVYQDTVDGYLSEYDPGQADALVMREWEQSGVSSAVLGLLADYDWPTFVTGIVVTKDHADNPNAVYLQKLLSALQKIQTNGIDYTEAGEDQAKSDLERLFTAAQHA